MLRFRPNGSRRELFDTQGGYQGDPLIQILFKHATHCQTLGLGPISPNKINKINLCHCGDTKRLLSEK